MSIQFSGFLGEKLKVYWRNPVVSKIPKVEKFFLNGSPFANIIVGNITKRFFHLCHLVLVFKSLIQQESNRIKSLQRLYTNEKREKEF